MDAAHAGGAHLCRLSRRREGRRARRPAPAFRARRHLAQLPLPLPGSQLDAQAHAGAVGPPGRDPRPPPALVDDLYRAQANDAYWHGLFGGLYLPHLRRAVWNNIVELEAELDRLQPRPALVVGDVDLDGRDETLARSTGLQIALRDDGLASAHELSSYVLNHNFGDTLRRYHEHYHDKISQGESRHHGDGIASAHDIVRFKHPISSADIVPDDLPRTLWRDELDGAPLTDYRANGLHFSRPHIDKTYALDGNTITVSWQLTGLAGRQFSTVLNLAMPSCDGFLGRYALADGSIPAVSASHSPCRPPAPCSSKTAYSAGICACEPGRPPTSAARRIKPSRSPRPALRKSCRLSNCA
jgi:hypothetical protein